jgi:D-sedoheptulose 7-phosphate isomerase
LKEHPKMSASNRLDAPVRERFLEISSMFCRAAESDYPARVQTAAECIADAFGKGKKMLVFGNGGSASDAQHLCGELVVRFQKDRRALPAIALCADVAVMTACGNDYSYSHVFARQIEALGAPGDIALGISTSGSSTNVVEALQTARKLGLFTILLTGPRSGIACDQCDLVLPAPGDSTARIQEVHLASYHCICEAIEDRLCLETDE